MKKTLHYLCQAMLLCAFGLTFIGCSKDEVETTGSIAGVITDEETGKVITGASVTISPSGKSVTTGLDGRYEFRDIEMGNYTVQALKAGYSANQKSVKVNPGETSSLDIPLRPSAPKLELSTQTLDFGSTSTTLTLDIRNTGSAELTWQLSEDIAWLNCVPTSGSTSSDKTSSVIVNVDRNGLNPGSYTQTLAIASNGGSQTINVTMKVPDDATAIEINPLSLDFGSTLSSLQLTLSNTDASRSLISYTLSASNNWIHLSKTQGQFTYTEVITVSVDRTSLAEGEYNGQLTLTMDGKTSVIPIHMTIATKEKPIVTMTSVKEVTYNNAKFAGALVSVGSSRVIRHGFVWGTTEQPSLETALKCDLGDAGTAKDFGYTVPNLQPSTTYFVRAYAENDEGISYSGQQKFTTSKEPSVPVVETGNVTNVTQRGATVTGNITELGTISGILAYGHVWSIQPNPTIANQKTNLGQSSKTGGFSSTMDNLTQSTTYYVRAYATNTVGTSYGQEISFTTKEGILPPTLAATTLFDITSSSAVATSAVTNNGRGIISDAGFCYGTSSTPTINGQKVSCGTQNSDFTGTLTGLSPSTTYYVRSYATNEEGTAYGAEITFTTLPDMVTRGLKAYYTFDEGTADNVYRDANHGYAIGGTYITDTPNSHGQALSLDGEEYVNIGSNIVDQSQSWTVSMWVKDFGTGPLFVTNNSKDDIGRPSFGISDEGNFGYKNNNTIAYKSGITTLVPLTNYMSGMWTLLTLTNNNGVCSLYVNGRKVDSFTHTAANMKGVGTSMVIGGKSPICTRTSQGFPYMTSIPDPMKVDNVRIHNVALTETEVQQVYNYEKQ